MNKHKIVMPGMDNNKRLYVTWSSAGILSVRSFDDRDRSFDDRERSSDDRDRSVPTKELDLSKVNVTAITATPNGQFVFLATSDPIAGEKNNTEISIRSYSIFNETNSSDEKRDDTVYEPKLFRVFKTTEASKFMLNTILLIS